MYCIHFILYKSKYIYSSNCDFHYAFLWAFLRIKKRKTFCSNFRISLTDIHLKISLPLPFR